MGLTGQAVAPPVPGPMPSSPVPQVQKSGSVCSGPRWADHSHSADALLPLDLLFEDWEELGGWFYTCDTKPFPTGTK